MKQCRARVGQLRICMMIVICLLVAAYVPWSTRAQSPATGLQVQNALIDLVVEPGRTYVHQMRVSSGTELPPLDITVEAFGFGQGLDGAFLPLPADQDTSPQSARTLVSSIDTPSFHLEPGSGRDVTVTLQVPQDLGSAPRYALIDIRSEPVGGGQLGFQVAAMVPVILTPANSPLVETGRIAELSVGNVTSGKPIEILTTFENTGNHHFLVGNTITLYDAQDKVIGEAAIPAAKPSVLPGASRQFRMTRGLLDLEATLPAGNYHVESVITHGNGTLMERRTALFEIDEPYDPFPGIPRERLLIVPLEDEEPGTIDARSVADLDVAFRDTGRVTGTVAIGRYDGEPESTTPLASARIDGGMEASGVKFAGIRVDGFSKGTARVTVYYDAGEIQAVDASSLFLAYRDDDGWHKLSDQAVFAGAQSVQGDIAVAKLASGPVIALGGTSADPGAGVQQAGLLAWFGENAVLTASAAAVLVAMLIATSLIITRGRRQVS